MSARPGQRPNGLPRDKICQFKLVLLGECTSRDIIVIFRILWYLYWHTSVVFDSTSYILAIFEMYTNWAHCNSQLNIEFVAIQENQQSASLV